MKRLARQFIAITLGFVASSVLAADTASLLEGQHAVELLDKNCIRTDIGSVIPVPFKVAANVLLQPDLIQRIEKEYCSSVSKSGTTDFPIIGNGKGSFHYINEKNQRTDIQELYRERTSEQTFDLIYLANGKRFFGKYDVLIHIRAVDAGVAGTLYTAKIYAYPHNPPLRFIARKTGSTERYFQRKTKLIASLSTHLCQNMCNNTPYIIPAPPSAPTINYQACLAIAPPNL